MQPRAPSKARYWQGIYLDQDETPVTIIRRHPIGIIAIILAGIAAIAVATIFFALLFPDSFNDNRSTTAGGILLFSAVVALIVLIAVYVYRQSKLLVTNKHLAQISQRTLVNRKISQLSMADVEDASADEKGILSTMFGYGTLIIQTAGELENFIFPLCPNPAKHADDILEARQSYTDNENT